MICPIPLTEIQNVEIEWLWKPFIAFGKVTLVQGETGIGKTSLMIKLLADLSNGVYPPTMYHKRLQTQQRAEPLKSYYVTVENGHGDTVAPMFDKYGGDRNYVILQDEEKGHFELTGKEIINCVEQTGARLIIVDPWQQFLVNASSSDNKAIRNMICDVQAAAERTGTAVVLAGNYTKSLGAEIRRGIGGSELNNTLRSILTVQDAPSKDPSIRIMRATKMSLPGKEMTPVVIQQDDEWNLTFMDYVDDEEDEIIWDEEPPEIDTTDPVEFLKLILKDGPLDRKMINHLADQNGIKMPSIYRAREKAGVVIQRQSDKSSIWSLDSFI